MTTSFALALAISILLASPPDPRTAPPPPDDRICFSRTQVAELRQIMADARERLIAERRQCDTRVARIHTDTTLEISRHTADLEECRAQRAGLLARKCGTCWLPWLLVGVGLAGGIGIGIAIGYGAGKR